MHDKLLAALGIRPKGFVTERKWPLPNMVRVTEREYWQWRSTYFTPKDEAWAGQVKLDDGWGTLLLFLIDQGQYLGGGFAVVTEHGGGQRGVRYYTWGDCVHDFDQKTIGNCLNQYTCSKCGRAYDVDSSD